MQTTGKVGVIVGLFTLSVPLGAAAADKKLAHTQHAKGTGLQRFKKRAAVLGGNIAGPAEKTKSTKLGKIFAQLGFAVSSGGGGGLPRATTEAVRKANPDAHVVAFTPANTVEEHLRGRPGAEAFSMVYATGAYRNKKTKAGIIEREGPLAEQNNMMFFIGGDIGTLGEYVAGLHTPGVMARLRKTGGVADAIGKLRHYLGPMPKHVRFVKSADEERLVNKADAALTELATVYPDIYKMPKNLAEPAGDRSMLTKKERDGKVVTLFAHDNQMTSEGKAELDKLVDAIGGDNTVVMQRRDGGTALGKDLIQRLKGKGSKVVQIAPGGTFNKAGWDKKTVRHAGFNNGVGEFMAQRPVVRDSKTVYVAGGDYKTLAGVIFARHHKTVIAVLESGGLTAGLKEILRVASKNQGGGKIVYAKTASELQKKAKKAREELDRPSFGSGSSGYGHHSSYGDRWLPPGKRERVKIPVASGPGSSGASGGRIGDLSRKPAEKKGGTSTPAKKTGVAPTKAPPAEAERDPAPKEQPKKEERRIRNPWNPFDWF